MSESDLIDEPLIEEISDTDPEFQNAEREHVRWNLRALTMDVSCFSVGMAFFDLNAVLPLLMERLGASGTLIGGFAAIRFLFFSGLQIFMAYVVHGRPKQKNLMAGIAQVTRTPLLFAPFILWHAARSEADRHFALWGLIIFLSIWAVGDGLGYVPWMEIVARAFTARTRGRFFAFTQLLSGVLSIGIAGLLVRTILNSHLFPYPINYAVLIGAMAVMMQLSSLGLWLVREPSSSGMAFPTRPDLGSYLSRLPRMVRENAEFRHLAAIQLLVGFGSASAPFYVLFGTSHFHLSDSWGGTYQVMLAIGVVALMPAWAYLAEKRGPAQAVRGVAFVCLLTPVAAMSIGLISPWLFGLVFLLMGGSLGWGLWIATNNYLLLHTEEENRPLYVALLNLLYAPSAIYPFLGGLLIKRHEFMSLWRVPALFLITSIVVGIGFLLSIRLPNPRIDSYPRSPSLQD